MGKKKSPTAYYRSEIFIHLVHTDAANIFVEEDEAVREFKEKQIHREEDEDLREFKEMKHALVSEDIWDEIWRAAFKKWFP
uniref:Uncharacterized protein n=1 Tax=Chenopodium quinoa TaxID=63459 RepID=A0A803KV88_CHEQI